MCHSKEAEFANNSAQAFLPILFGGLCWHIFSVFLQGTSSQKYLISGMTELMALKMVDPGGRGEQ